MVTFSSAVLAHCELNVVSDSPIPILNPAKGQKFSGGRQCYIAREWD